MCSIFWTFRFTWWKLLKVCLQLFCYLNKVGSLCYNVSNGLMSFPSISLKIKRGNLHLWMSQNTDRYLYLKIICGTCKTSVLNFAKIYGFGPPLSEKHKGTSTIPDQHSRVGFSELQSSGGVEFSWVIKPHEMSCEITRCVDVCHTWLGN